LLVVAIGVLGLAGAPRTPTRRGPRSHFELGRRYFQVDEYSKATKSSKAAHIEEADSRLPLQHRRVLPPHGAEPRGAGLLQALLEPDAGGCAVARQTAEKRIAELQGTSTSTPAPPASAPVTTLHRPRRRRDAHRAGAATARHGGDCDTARRDAGGGADVAGAPADQTSRPFYKSGWFYVVLAPSWSRAQPALARDVEPHPTSRDPSSGIKGCSNDRARASPQRDGGPGVDGGRRFAPSCGKSDSVCWCTSPATLTLPAFVQLQAVLSNGGLSDRALFHRSRPRPSRCRPASR